jgi:hypothetical protein
MTIADLYQRYRTAGYAAAIDRPTEQTDELFYQALLAFSEQDLPRAAGLATRAAAAAPSTLLYSAAASYLARASAGGRQGVYLAPEAFSAFIRGGGNLPLYEATSAALRAVYQQSGAASLLDVGVGDGLALLPALAATIARVDLIEPSAALLEQTSARLRERGVPHRPFNRTLQDFAATAPAGDSWDIIQATFSMQSIAPGERGPLLAWMRERGQRVLIAEFDVPHFTAMHAPDRVEYVAARFEQGLAEYADDGGLVAQGFLMPVMFGYFDRTAARTNYEHPLREWADQLRAAGFAEVRAQQLYPYWWAPAFLLDAR